jgi:hypothetical protein
MEHLQRISLALPLHPSLLWLWKEEAKKTYDTFFFRDFAEVSQLLVHLLSKLLALTAVGSSISLRVYF